MAAGARADPPSACLQGPRHPERLPFSPSLCFPVCLSLPPSLCLSLPFSVSPPSLSLSPSLSVSPRFYLCLPPSPSLSPFISLSLPPFSSSSLSLSPPISLSLCLPLAVSLPPSCFLCHVLKGSTDHRWSCSFPPFFSCLQGHRLQQGRDLPRGALSSSGRVHLAYNRCSMTSPGGLCTLCLGGPCWL